MNIAIVYHSVTGTTAQLAEAVAAGCSSVAATTAVLLRIEVADIKQGRYNNRAVIQAIDQADVATLSFHCKAGVLCCFCRSSAF